MKLYYKVKLYLSARISLQYRAYNETIANALEKHFDVFLPHEHQGYEDDHTKIGPEVFNIDVVAMRRSECCLLLPPYGRDCAFEIGDYHKAEKPVYIFTDGDLSWQCDLMIKGTVSQVFTTNESVYQKLVNDVVIGNRITLVRSLEELASALLTRVNGDLKGKVIVG